MRDELLGTGNGMDNGDSPRDCLVLVETDYWSCAQGYVEPTKMRRVKANAGSQAASRKVEGPAPVLANKPVRSMESLKNVAADDLVSTLHCDGGYNFFRPAEVACPCILVHGAACERGEGVSSDCREGGWVRQAGKREAFGSLGSLWL
jgi:hypothetical protein